MRPGALQARGRRAACFIAMTYGRGHWCDLRMLGLFQAGRLAGEIERQTWRQSR